MAISFCKPAAVKHACRVNVCADPGTARAGITLSQEELERVSDLAREHGAWLVMDCTYENFLFSGTPHHCPQGPHVVHVFSFSKVR